jgi:hypothetical protein
VKLECHHIRAGVAVSFHYGEFRQVFTVAYLSAAVDKSDRPIQDELLTVRGHAAPGKPRLLAGAAPWNTRFFSLPGLTRVPSREGPGVRILLPPAGPLPHH